MSVFKGTTGFFQYDATDILRYNLTSWLDWGLLEMGAFESVDKDGRNSNLATLQEVKDERETDGTVYEAFGPSIVWQSGLSPIAGSPDVINVSGVWIDGSFFPNGTTGSDGFTIDYQNGRVIFNEDKSDSTIQMNYSFPHVGVYDSYSWQWRDIIDSYEAADFSNIGSDSPSGIASNLKERRVWTPCVILEVQDRTNQPLQLGGGEIHEYAVFYHIFSGRDFDVTRICDTLNNQESKTLKLFDVNKARSSGVIPFNYDGSLPSGSLEYNTLRQNNNGYFWTYGRIDSSRGGKRPIFSDISRGEVVQSISVTRYPSTY